jgi:hypothetical protein
MTEPLILPSSPADKEKLKKVFDEAVVCLQRIDDQREALKEIFTHIKETFQIDPKYSRKLARTYFKNKFNEVQAESEEFESLYTAIIGIDD